MADNMIEFSDTGGPKVTYLLPVYGHCQTGGVCRAAVWQFDQHAYVYYRHMGAKFMTLTRLNNEVVEVVLDAFPREFRWLDDGRFNVYDVVPTFDDTGKPQRVPPSVYDVPHPELDTDEDRVVLSREGLRFRTVRGSTIEHYETELFSWEAFGKAFKETNE